MEPIIDKSSIRFVLFPIQYPDLWRLYKTTLNSFWVSEDVNTATTKEDWLRNLNGAERELAGMVIKSLALSHHSLPFILAPKLYSQITIGEARCSFGFYIAIQNIQMEAISGLLSELSLDPLVLDNALVAALSAKSTWIERKKNSPFAFRLTVLIVVERLLSISPFTLLYKLNNDKHISGINDLLKKIQNDLDNRVELLFALFHHLNNKPSDNEISTIVVEAVELEKSFLSCFPEDILSIGLDNARKFIEFAADDLLQTFGLPLSYNTHNPLPWMTPTENGAEKALRLIRGVEESKREKEALFGRVHPSRLNQEMGAPTAIEDSEEF